MSTVTWKDVPTSTVDVGGTEFAYRDLGPRTELPVIWAVSARELDAAPERDECWSIAADVYPGFDSYQQFTERRIPVAVLERRAA